MNFIKVIAHFKPLGNLPTTIELLLNTDNIGIIDPEDGSIFLRNNNKIKDREIEYCYAVNSTDIQNLVKKN